MHELSIVMSIVDIASREAKKANAQTVEEIELEIGELSGVEMTSFDFAWKQGIKNSVLSQAELIINRPPGQGQCLDCENTFVMYQLYDACPHCKSPFITIQQGKEMRVKSLVVT